MVSPALGDPGFVRFVKPFWSATVRAVRAYCEFGSLALLDTVC